MSQAAGKNPGFFSGDLWKPPVGRDVRPPPHCYSRRHLGVKRFRRSQKRKHSHFLTQGTAKGPQHVYQAGQKEHLQGKILEFFEKYEIFLKFKIKLNCIQFLLFFIQ